MKGKVKTTSYLLKYMSRRHIAIPHLKYFIILLKFIATRILENSQLADK